MGRLEVITGPMFSGKSEELIRRVTRAKIAGKTVLAVKPVIDNRYSDDQIVSHSGGHIDAHSEPNIWLLEKWAVKSDIIAIDEAQFFDNDTLIEQINLALLKGKIIIVAGLDMTYRQEPFGAMPILMAMADTVLKLSAVCAVCGEDAMMTQRLIDGEPAPFSGETVLVGGLESYEARCRSCFMEG